MNEHEPKIDILISLAQIRRYMNVYMPHLDLATDEVSKIETLLEQL